MDWKQVVLGLMTALAAGGAGGIGGYQRGYEEREAAIERAQCKIRDLKVAAKICGWVRPVEWCAVPLPLEER
jgi:hypothetical protein